MPQRGVSGVGWTLATWSTDLHAPPRSASGPGERGESPPEDAVQAVDEWLERVCRDRPVVKSTDPRAGQSTFATSAD